MNATITNRPALTNGRKTFLHELFTTAVEGGINDWALVGKYRWGLLDKSDDIDGFYATIKSTEDDWGVDRTFQSTVADPQSAGVSVLGSGYLAPPADAQALRIDLAVLDHGVRLFARYCRGEIDSRGREVPEGDRTELPDDHYWRQFLVAEATHGGEG